MGRYGAEKIKYHKDISNWTLQKILSNFNSEKIVITELGMENFFLHDEVEGMGQLPVVFDNTLEALAYIAYRNINDCELRHTTGGVFETKEVYLVTTDEPVGDVDVD